MYYQLQINPGQVFNQLTIVREGERHVSASGISYRMFLCKCTCGKLKLIKLNRLVVGRTKSCGCLAGESHGLSDTRIYKVWESMKERCYRKNTSKSHKKNYQEKGIDVCPQWMQSFSCFYEWAISSGYTDSLQIDRIDNSKGYYPENCRFVSNLINSNNRDNNLRVNVNGSMISVTELLIQSGVDLKYQMVVYKRIKRGWPYLEAMKPPFTRSQPRRMMKVVQIKFS